VKTGRATIVCAVLLWASAVFAECTPEGRAAFTSGLDALNRGDLTAAASSFGELVKAQPDCAEARNNLAAVLVEQGHIEDAAEQLRQALTTKPDYARARLNLQRVEAMLAARTQETPAAQPTIEVSAEPTVAVAAAPTVAPTAATEHAAAAPRAIAALEPKGTNACVIDPQQNRICVYQRTEGSIDADACYVIAAARVRVWPEWLTASDLNPRRIRLVDENGVKRLKVVPATGAAGKDEVRLAAADFEALSKKVRPWRTGCVVSSGEAQSQTLDAAGVAAVKDAIERWRQVWERKDLDAYTGMYSRSFEPQSDANVGRWRARKRRVFEEAGSVSIQFGPLSIFVLDQGRAAVATFEQSYRSNAITSRDFKALRWRREGDGWKITAETVLQESQ